MKNKLLSLSGYLVLLYVMYTILYWKTEGEFYPNNENLIQWDAFWYYLIKDRGYVFVPNKTCNMAFFPLFPYFWKVTMASPVVISTINFILFASCFVIIIIRQNVGIVASVFLLSVPIFVFYALPYSESLFFVFSTILIYGFEQKNKKLQFIGFLGMSIARSVSIVAIPALLISTFFLKTDSSSIWTKLKASALNILASVLGLLISAVIQGSQTGKWFYFFEIQKYWRRHWIVPEVPFSTHSPERMLGIDGLAFIIGVMAGVFCLSWIYKFLMGKKLGYNVSQAVFFSVLYTTGVMILDVIFTYNQRGSANIWSISRHVLCPPFAIFFLIWWIKEGDIEKTIGYALIPIIIIGVFVTGIFKYPDHIFFVLVFLGGLFILKYHPKYEKLALFACFINLLLQLQIFNSYLNGGWIG